MTRFDFVPGRLDYWLPRRQVRFLSLAINEIFPDYRAVDW